MVLGLIQGAGVWEKQHLRIGVNAEVKLDGVLLTAQKVGYGLRFGFRFREGTAVDLTAGIIGGSLRWWSNTGLKSKAFENTVQPTQMDNIFCTLPCNKYKIPLA